MYEKKFAKSQKVSSKNAIVQFIIFLFVICFIRRFRYFAAKLFFSSDAFQKEGFSFLKMARKKGSVKQTSF